MMADAQGCELARPLISELQVEANGIEVHLLGGEIWRLPRGLLSRSLLLRKLAEWSEDRGCFVLRPRCASTLESLRVVLDWPRSPAEVLRWLLACDFLLVSPKDSELIFVVTSALDVWLADVDAALADCSTSEALQASRRLATYGSLELFLCTPSLVWRGGYDGDDGYDPPSVAAGEQATTGCGSRAFAAMRRLRVASQSWTSCHACAESRTRNTSGSTAPWSASKGRSSR
jgi:hypothetical protein